MRRLLSFSVALLCLGSGCRVREEPPRSREAPQAPQEVARAPEPSAEPSELPAEPSSASPPKRVYRVAALGDSITDEKVGGGRYLAHLRKACPRSTFFDFGKGGDMTNQMLVRLERDLLPARERLDLDTLIVFGGVNDLYSNLTASRTNDRIEQSLLAIYERARKAGLRTVGITVLPWGGFSRYFTPERGENTRALNAFLLGQVSRGTLDVAVDAYPRLSCGQPERLCPTFEMSRPDGLHPGPEGHRVLGALLQEQAFSDCL